MQPSVPDAVVFDLDGTLVDTVPARIRAWREVFADDGFQVDDAALEPMIGMDGRRLAREVAASARRELDDDERRTHRPRRRGSASTATTESPGRSLARRTRSPGSTPRDDVGDRDLLARGAGARPRSRRSRLDHPPRIVDGSRVAHAKPAPDLLLLAAERARCRADGRWYVGDSTWDMRAAVAAGMHPVAVLAGAAVDERRCDRCRGAAVVLTLSTSSSCRADAMPLEEYRRKRDFGATPEPAPGDLVERSGRFTVQRHRATALHYDFRLEIDGVLVSWAVPKGPTLDPGERRLAMRTEDHPIEYLDFEGVIPKGQYGARRRHRLGLGHLGAGGRDAGSAARRFAKGEIKFVLHGERLGGPLHHRAHRSPRRRVAGRRDQWLLMHKRDETAVDGWDAEDHPRRVKSAGGPMTRC